MTISQTIWFLIWNKDIHRDTNFLYWHNSLFLGALLLCLQSGEGGKDSIAFVRVMNASAVITLGGEWVPALGGCAQLAFILVNMMVVVAPTAWARARPKLQARRRSWTRLTSFSGQIAGAQLRELVIMHGLVALFLGVIVLAIILLVIGLRAFWVLVVTLRAIVALIISMTIVRLVIIVIALVALMIVTVVTTAMLTVAWFTATRSRNMNHFLFLWLLLVLGNLIKNASCLVGCLTLLKEGNHSEWVKRHCLIQVRELVLVCFGLRKEDLFTLLLRCRYVHSSTEVVTLKVAEKLHSAPHELVHWHESGLLGHTQPANQLVANVGEPGNDLNVVPDALVKVYLRTICIVWASFCNNAGPLCQAYLLEALTQGAKQQLTIVLLRIR